MDQQCRGSSETISRIQKEIDKQAFMESEAEAAKSVVVNENKNLQAEILHQKEQMLSLHNQIDTLGREKDARILRILKLGFL